MNKYIKKIYICDTMTKQHNSKTDNDLVKVYTIVLDFFRTNSFDFIYNYDSGLSYIAKYTSVVI